MSLLWLLFVTWAAVANAYPSTTVRAPDEIVDGVEIFDAYVRSENPTQKVSVHLLPREAGSRREFVVRLHNRSASRESINLEDVQLGCNCTKAKVPRVSVPYGESARLEFAIDLANHPREPVDNFSGSIRTSGACKSIDLSFHVEFVNYVGFHYREFTQTFAASEKESVFRIPLFTTDQGLVHKITIKPSDDLKFLRTKVVSIGDRAFVETRFDPQNVKESQSAGEIHLMRDGRVLDSLVCFLENKNIIEFLPARMAFAPGREVESDSTTSTYSGSSVLKLRLGTNAEIKEIVCRAPAGNALDLSWAKLNASTFRVRVKVRDSVELLANEGELRWEVTDATGKKFYETSTFFCVAN